jgi:hypothetical protein
MIDKNVILIYFPPASNTYISPTGRERLIIFTAFFLPNSIFELQSGRHKRGMCNFNRGAYEPVIPATHHR